MRFCVNFDDDDLYAPGYVDVMVSELIRRRLGALTLSATGPRTWFSAGF